VLDTGWDRPGTADQGSRLFISRHHRVQDLPKKSIPLECQHANSVSSLSTINHLPSPPILNGISVFSQEFSTLASPRTASSS